MALCNRVGSPERVCLEVFVGELPEKMTWWLRWFLGGICSYNLCLVTG
ncbi:hypothetical protein HanPI659440_Chr15g0598231 [Helianthus annuus]|nr:hypothetical protein HanPI659440_Chr15g0598231 [Helianthus annuus]